MSFRLSSSVFASAFVTLVVAGASGCTIEAAGSSGSSTGASNGAGGGVSASANTYGGTYEVPVPVELTPAATFDVTEIEWTVVGGTARLAYNLPRALVGKAVRVDFTGPIDATTNVATLSGVAGTSTCQIAATSVVCNETMQGLLPLNSDLTVVEALAATTYAGPVADRIAVANRFAGDPIGIAHIDLTRPGVPEPAVVDDKGKGK